MNRFTWLAPALLCIIVLGVFSPTFSGGLIWDDKDLIGHDPRIRELSGFGRLWTQPFAAQDKQSVGIAYYRPLTTFTLMINYQMGGEDPAAYHGTNVLLHLLCTLTVFFLARALLLRPWPCLVIALLFALHPSRTENVAWISGRTDLLAGLLLFLSFLGFVLHQQQGKPWFLRFSVIAFVAALFAKESALPFPLILALYAYFTGQQGSLPGRMKSAMSRTWLFFAGSGLFFLLLIFMGAFQGQSNYAFDSLTDHLLYIFQTLKLYVGIIFWPFNFHYIATAILPDGMNYHDLAEGALVASLVSVIALTLWIWFSKRKPLVSFCFLAWIVALVPALNLVVLPCTVSLRHLYVPLFFVILGLWWCGESAVDLIIRRASGAARLSTTGLPKAGLLLSLVIAAIFGGVSYVQNANWHDEGRFWEAHLESCPDSANVHCHMGLIVQDQQKPEVALTHFKRACELAPDIELFSFYCGNAYKAVKNYPDAEACYIRALDLNPGFGKAANRLAVLYDVMGEKRKAEPFFQKAISLLPRRPGFRSDYGVFLFNQGKYGDAAKQFEAAMELNPADISYYEYLGLSCEQMGEAERAVNIYKKGLSRDPHNKRLKFRLDQAAKKIRN